MVRQGNTVLHLGAGWGNVKVVALLLEVRTMSRLSVQQQPRFESFSVTAWRTDLSKREGRHVGAGRLARTCGVGTWTARLLASWPRRRA